MSLPIHRTSRAKFAYVYLAKTSHFTFTISGENADTSLAELCAMGGLQDSDTPFLEVDTRFKAVSTTVIRLVVRSRKLFSVEEGHLSLCPQGRDTLS
jgi:hypothetical protein